MNQRIDGATRLTAVIGDPVAHSLSPVMHNAAFQALSLNWVYVALRVSSGRLGAAIAGLRALGCAGANVTLPHKQAVVEHVDESRGEALATGAVNTLVFDGDRLIGHNTDVEGFRAALREAVPEGVAGATVLLLGAGGAARAAALALAEERIAALTVADRTPRRAVEVGALAAGAAPCATVRALALRDLGSGDVAVADLVVNATTMGMPGQGKVPGVLVDNVGVDQIVYDVVYGSRPTELLSEARARGARCVDGRDMLVWQAAVAFGLWTGREAPVQVMRDAVGR